MITTKNVHGPASPDETDSTFVTLKANNGTAAKYSLFALNLDRVPDTLEHQGRTYERKEGNVLVEKAEEKAQARPEPKPAPKPAPAARPKRVM